MKQHSNEDLIKEVLWENHQIEEGVRRYREALADKSPNDTKGGMRLIQSTTPNTVAGIKAAYKDVETTLMSGKAGNTPNWLFLIGMVKAEQAAVIVISQALKHSTSPDNMLTLTTLANNVGAALRQQLMFENWKKNERAKVKEHNATCEEGEEYSKSFAEILIERAKGNVTRPKLARWRSKFDTYTNIEWGADQVVIGMKLIEIMVDCNPDVFSYKMVTIKGKKQRLLNLTEAAWVQVQSLNDGAELNTPALLPTLIQPLEWHYEDGQVVGGYHHIKQPLFSQRVSKHTAADPNATSQRFLDSITQVQNTAWAINPYMCMVIDMIVGTKQPLGEVPSVCTLEAPHMPEADYNAMTPEARKAYHQERSAVLEEIASQRGRHGAFARKLVIARKLLQHDKFYFPHFADFRGRIYPMPQELTPQGDQVAKSLLCFAEGKPLGKDGLYWLKVHAANTYGKDKLSLAERVAWTEANLENMAESSIDPLTYTFWSKANEPLTFLAAAKELTDAHEVAQPCNYVSRIPVAMDGTCNGIQLLSLLGRDNVGAEKTNCRAIDQRFDLYSEVAAKVLEICARDRFTNATAEEWYARLHNAPGRARKVVKRAVMTTPYGVTARGIAKQLVGDKHCNDLGDVSRLTASDYMKDCILEAMAEVNGKAVEIMGYIQDTAAKLAEQQLPLSWYTPVGLKVTQAYYKQADKRIQTVFGTVVLWAEDKAMGMDAQKQYQSSAPNVIHSFDAAMLQMTVEKLAALGHTDFAMIHDSYGMHASEIGLLHSVLRQAAFEIFSHDNLAEFHAYVQAQTEVVLRKPPAHGAYDMSEIVRAPYFFS